MPKRKIRVYCAGPLFNDKEQEEMKEISDSLEKAGFETFLPQRDGLEFALCTQALINKGISSEDANNLLSKAIFALDVYQVVYICDAIVVNLNGRVPDEGTISEAALAWHAGKYIVGYKADHRSLINGNDNPLVTGLFNFQIENCISSAVEALKTKTGSIYIDTESNSDSKHTHIVEYLSMGAKIWDAMRSSNIMDEVASLLASELLDNNVNRLQ